MEKNDILCFVHIEKTAGTTLKHVFRRKFYLRHLTVRPYYKQENCENKPYSAVFSAKDLQFVLRMNPFIKIISGHSLKPSVDLEHIGKRIKYITILRNPVNRYLSHYEHSIRINEAKWTFDDFMNIEEHNNFQTRKIAGKEDLNLAKNILAKKFYVVGIVEQFENFLELLSFKLNFNKKVLRYEIKNRGKNKDLVSELRSKYLNKIINKNELDIKLYKYVEEKLLAEQKEKVEEYFLNKNKTDRVEKLSALDQLKIKTDYYYESFYFDPIAKIIRMMNGLKPKGSYL